MSRSLLLLPLAIVALVGCSAGSSPAPSTAPSVAPASPPAAVHLDASANGTTVTVAPGTPITLELASNATTGYSWVPTTLPDYAFVAIDGPTEGVYVAPSSQPGLAGAGGTQVWALHATKAGTTTFGLGYLRSWESSVPPVDTFSVTFVVK
jgi:inhibitor of cysteine peptidase